MGKFSVIQAMYLDNSTQTNIHEHLQWALSLYICVHFTDCIYEERVHFGVYVVYESRKMSAFIIIRTN